MCKKILLPREMTVVEQALPFPFCLLPRSPKETSSVLIRRWVESILFNQHSDLDLKRRKSEPKSGQRNHLPWGQPWGVRGIRTRGRRRWGGQSEEEECHAEDWWTDQDSGDAKVLNVILHAAGISEGHKLLLDKTDTSLKSTVHHSKKFLSPLPCWVTSLILLLCRYRFQFTYADRGGNNDSLTYGWW